MNNRPVALIIAPFKTATEEEQTLTLRAHRHLLAFGWAPVFYPWALERALSDHVPDERSIALACSKALVQSIARDLRSNAFIVGSGSLTEGMKQDIDDWTETRVITIRAVRASFDRFGLIVPSTAPRRLLWDARDAAPGFAAVPA